MATKTAIRYDYLSFQGYNINAPDDGWYFIDKPDGTRLGKAYSIPGAKRMIRKDAGTNVCVCGHIPSGHVSWRDDDGRVHGGCGHHDGPADNRVRCWCKCTPSQASAARDGGR